MFNTKIIGFIQVKNIIYYEWINVTHTNELSTELRKNDVFLKINSLIFDVKFLNLKNLSKQILYWVILLPIKLNCFNSHVIICLTDLGLE